MNGEEKELANYFQRIKDVQPLSKEDEIKYWKMMRFGSETERKTGREALITSLLRFVVSMVTKYKTDSVEMMELIQEGNLGLIESLESFDPQKGRLTTWSSRFIKHRVFDLISRERFNTQLGYSPGSDAVFNLDLRKLEDQRNEFRQKYGRNPSDDELEKPRQMSDRRFQDLMKFELGHLTRSDVDSLEIPDVDCNTDDELIGQLYDAIAQLPESERQVIEMVYGLDGQERTPIKEVAKKMGITYEKCRQLRIAGTINLRKHLKNDF